jgi:hypothetical protein
MITIDWEMWVSATLLWLGILLGLSYFMEVQAVGGPMPMLYLSFGHYTGIEGRWHSFSPSYLLSSDFAIGLMLQGLSVVFMTGITEMAIRRLEGRPVGFYHVFLGFEAVAPIFVIGVLTSLASGLASYLFCLPMFWVVGMLSLAPILIYRGKAQLFDAYVLSFSLLRSHAWMITCVTFVGLVLAILGILGCGLGLLFTWSIPAVTTALVYLQFFPVRPATVDESPEQLLPARPVNALRPWVVKVYALGVMVTENWRPLCDEA